MKSKQQVKITLQSSTDTVDRNKNWPSCCTLTAYLRKPSLLYAICTCAKEALAIGFSSKDKNKSLISAPIYV
jgi:hypothetical protein